MSRSFRTKAGTELPLMSLRGKDYLEVKYRIVWFREEHPDWSIETEIVSVTDESSFAKATIRDNTGRVVSTSHKFENKQGFADFIEKSETGAIGRALALIGYGTQFCADELDEGERVVDSPAQRPQAKPATRNDPAEYVVQFGKFKGRRLGEMDVAELANYVAYIEMRAKEDGKPLRGQVLEFVTAAANLVEKRQRMYEGEPA